MDGIRSMQENGGGTGRIQGSHYLLCNDGTFAYACDHYSAPAGCQAIDGSLEPVIQLAGQLANGIRLHFYSSQGGIEYGSLFFHRSKLDDLPSIIFSIYGLYFNYFILKIR
jgi:hypothetical protein